MSQWLQGRLKDVLTPVSEYVEVPERRAYLKLSVRLYGKGVVLDTPTDGALLKMQRHQVAKAGQVIVSEIWGKKGAVGLVPPEGDGALCTSHFFLFDIQRERVDPKFLDLIFKANYLEGQLNAEARGTTGYAAVRPRHFLACEIPLPPIAEQSRVVARIEELAGRIREARTLRQESRAAADALLSSAARAMIDSLDSPVSPLGNWLDPSREGIQTGPFGAQLSRSEFTDTGRPVLTIGNVQYVGLDTRKLKCVSEVKASQLQRYQVREGDLLFARMGTVGRCCVVPATATGWLINYHIIRVALDTRRLDPRFANWSIRASTLVEEYLGEKIRGATREGVNSRIVAGLPCRVPSISEQCRIVGALDALQAEVEAMERLMQETGRELDALLSAILDRAFKGELV